MAKGIDRSVLAAEGSAAVRSQVTLANAVRAAGPPLLFGFKLWAPVCLAVHIFFNNAGIEGDIKPIPDYPLETFRRVLDQQVTKPETMTFNHCCFASVPTNGINEWRHRHAYKESFR
jgi:NAD(P)-dependent dehydrogenase (short-subunit alcohol dehydrogenase family)